MNALNALVSANDLKIQLEISDPKTVVVDATMHLPTANRNALQEYEEAHIPTAVFFDIDKIADTSSDLPHMLPSAQEFSKTVAGLGIGKNTPVVVYDTVGLYSAARVWWMFRVFGHNAVQVLDGGLPAWQAKGYALEAGSVDAIVSQNPIEATLSEESVASAQAVRDAIGSNTTKILDARSKARFDGVAPEPRKGLRSGHMPGAYSLPFTELLTTNDEKIIRLKSVDALKAVFDNCGVEPNDSVITSCGSGVTAAVLTLGLHVVGYNEGQLYDGSWVDWGSRSDTPIE